MTVSNLVSRADHVGNGGTTVFAFAFRILDEADLRVTVTDTDGNDTILTLGDDYTVSGVGSYNGGAVTLTEALADQWRMTTRRVLTQDQPLDLNDQGAFPPELIENQFDRLVMMVQAIQDEVDRSMKFSETVDPDSVSLFLPTPEAGKFVGGNAGGDAFIMIDPGSVELAIPATDSVATAMLQDDSVTEDKLADDAVTTDKIANGSISEEKLAPGAISLASLLGTLGIVDYADPVLITGADTATPNRHHICTGTSADYPVTLPPADDYEGATLSFQMSTPAALTKLVTLDGDGFDINGQEQRIMWANEYCLLRSDGVEWKKQSGLTIPMMASISRSGSPQSIDVGFERVTTNLTLIDGGMEINVSDASLNARRDGVYQISISGQWYVSNLADNVGLYVEVNADQDTSFPQVKSDCGTATTFLQHGASLPVPLEAGDEVILWAIQDGADAVNLMGHVLAAVELPTW